MKPSCLHLRPALFTISVPYRPGDGWSQHRVDAQEYHLMQQY
jgi:hypothetical protein